MLRSTGARLLVRLAEAAGVFAIICGVYCLSNAMVFLGWALIGAGGATVIASRISLISIRQTLANIAGAGLTLGGLGTLVFGGLSMMNLASIMAIPGVELYLVISLAAFGAGWVAFRAGQTA